MLGRQLIAIFSQDHVSLAATIEKISYASDPPLVFPSIVATAKA